MNERVDDDIRQTSDFKRAWGTGWLWGLIFGLLMGLGVGMAVMYDSGDHVAVVTPAHKV